MTLITTSCRPEILKLSTVKLSEPPATTRALNGGMLQMTTTTVRMMNGDHAFRICPVVYLAGSTTSARKGECFGTPVLFASANANDSAGCQKFRKAVVATRHTSAEVMSGNCGPI